MDWTRGKTIGRGSSATVSIATASQSGEVFAVKSAVLSKSALLQREQRILSMLNCPQIVGYVGHDVTREDDGVITYNLFMEYVSGGTLSDAIQRQGGKLDEDAIRSHTIEILRGLRYLHSNRLVHCDIKGQNVLIGSEGAKIADLGCARWVDDEVSALGIAGTPVFMAPEVARGEEQSFPADVWALGCTVIEMASGRPPWPEVSDPISAVYRIAFSDDLPELPSWLSEEAQDFLEKCLRRDAKDRWTVNQLLKHPFLVETDSNLKQIQVPTTNSPTSILDQGFWDSLEEESEGTMGLSSTSSSNSAAERLRGMSSSRTPTWTWDDENWVTIRSSDDRECENSWNRDQNTSSHLEEPATTNSPVWISDEEEETELFGASVSSSSISTCGFNVIRHDSCIRGEFTRDCTCKYSSCNLNFDSQRDYYIFNPNQILLKL